MSLEFRSRKVTARMLDPRNGFQELGMDLEYRFDPLTGRTGRVYLYHALPRLEQPPDLSELHAFWEKVGCPFCPDRVNQVTPRFPKDIVPEGHLHKGEATVIPNISAYDEHSALCIISRQHFLRPAELTPALLFDAFALSRDFQRSLHRVDPSLCYVSITWNYLPNSGGSVLHPHLGIYAGHAVPSALAQMIAASGRYAADHGRAYWSDYLDAERRGERFLRTIGTTDWLADFAPMGIFGDLLGFVRGRSSILDLTDEELHDLVRGLHAGLRYIDNSNRWSFNMVLFSGMPADRDFWLHARLVSRYQPSPAPGHSDMNAFNYLSREGMAIRTPEQAAQEMRPYFTAVT